MQPGTRVRAWAYNGQVPGPEIRVREGDRVRITLTNHLPVGTTIHWHGLDVPPEMDGPAGLNQAPVESGQSFTYDWIATPAGTRWYHSHTDVATQVMLGLYGSLIVEPKDWDPDRVRPRLHLHPLRVGQRADARCRHRRGAARPAGSDPARR